VSVAWTETARVHRAEIWVEREERNAEAVEPEEIREGEAVVPRSSLAETFLEAARTETAETFVTVAVA